MLIPEDFHLERKQLGQILRLAREEECFTVREVATRSGLDFTHVSKIELGNTNVSLEKFARLCYALMLPPGIVMESCIWVSRAEGFLNDSMTIRLTSEHRGYRGLDNEISSFIAGTALALSYTLKSSNPPLMLDNMSFAVEAQRDDFKKFVSERAAWLNPARRREILFLALTKGGDYLASLGLLNDAHLKAYLTNAQHRKHPWIPIPKAPFFQDQIAPIDAVKANVRLLIASAQRNAGKFNLDKKNLPAMLTDMRLEVPTWPELKKTIKRLTAERGKKKALADKIGVSRQVLGNWLSDDSQGAPNADLTLELLKWSLGKAGK